MFKGPFPPPQSSPALLAGNHLECKKNRLMCHSACHLRNGVSGTALPPIADGTAIVEMATSPCAGNDKPVAHEAGLRPPAFRGDRPDNQGLFCLWSMMRFGTFRAHVRTPELTRTKDTARPPKATRHRSRDMRSAPRLDRGGA